MSTRVITSVLSASLLLYFGLLSFLPLEAQERRSGYVQLQKVEIRGAPKHFAPRLASATYGDSLKVLSEQNGWVEVENGNGVKGFVHQSALAERPIVFEGKSRRQGVEQTGGDVVLAGKGFNAEVLQAVAEKRGDLNLKAIESLEKIELEEADIRRFIRDGQLVEAENGVL